MEVRPLRQGDLDGLCGVYAALNAAQWLIPPMRDNDYLTKLFGQIIGKIYTIHMIRDGGEEPELKTVFDFIAREVRRRFGKVLRLRDGTAFEFYNNNLSPSAFMERTFNCEPFGVFIIGFEGYDSHWTVARGITTEEIILFDSWEYHTFRRNQLVWDHQVPDYKKSTRIVVALHDLNWITVHDA